MESGRGGGGSLVGVDREGQEVTRELCLNNEEPSHGDLREEPSGRRWMRCLLSAHSLTAFWIKFVEASQRARGDLEGQEGRFSVWRNHGSSSTPRDREKEIPYVQVEGEWLPYPFLQASW